MIKFIIKGKKNPQKKTETKYYAQIAPTTPLMLPQIVKLIEKRSTVSSSDIKALQTGNSVRLGDLGSFHLTISSKGTATEEEAKKAGANLIKKVSVQFVKSAEMGRAFSLDELSFVQG